MHTCTFKGCDRATMNVNADGWRYLSNCGPTVKDGYYCRDHAEGYRAGWLTIEQERPGHTIRLTRSARRPEDDKYNWPHDTVMLVDALRSYIRISEETRRDLSSLGVATTGIDEPHLERCRTLLKEIEEKQSIHGCNEQAEGFTD